MKKRIGIVMILLLCSIGLQVVAQTMYEPTQAELQFIKRVENTLRNRYKNKQIQGVVSDQIVSFMATIDEKLSEDTITPRVDRVLGTTKWYLLRIIEQTFPWEVAETAIAKPSTNSPDIAPSNDAEDSPTPSPQYDRGVEYDGEYTLVDVDARKWTFMPALITVQANSKVKLVVHDVDLQHEIFFPDLQVWKDAKGTYIIDTTVPGKYTYLCSSRCGVEYEKMIGTVVIE